MTHAQDISNTLVQEKKKAKYISKHYNCLIYSILYYRLKYALNLDQNAALN